MCLKLFDAKEVYDLLLGPARGAPHVLSWILVPPSAPQPGQPIGNCYCCYGPVGICSDFLFSRPGNGSILPAPLFVPCSCHLHPVRSYSSAPPPFGRNFWLFRPTIVGVDRVPGAMFHG